MKKEIKNICLVAITRLGDMLQASPTIYALKQKYPQARITVITEKQFAGICDGIPGIDEVYIIDLGMMYRCLIRDYQDVVDAYNSLDRIVQELRDKHFDCCINMSSSGYTALLLRMLAIEDSRGWISDDEGNRIISNPWAMVFAAFIFHANRQYNSLNIVDIFRCSAELREFPKKLMYEPKPEDEEYAKAFLRENNLDQDRPLVCVQVGASQEKRQWSPSYFARLTKLLVEELGARVVYTGAGSEIAIIEKVMKFYHHPQAVSAAGKTKLGQLAGLLKQARLLVTGDTGTMHMAVSVNTPVVALFLASAYCYETGPYSAGNIIIEPKISCYTCNPNFSCLRPDCHEQVTPELVKKMVQLRLQKSAAELIDYRFSPGEINPAVVGIKVSYFDEDGYLDFKAMNGFVEREGVDERVFEASRRAYRALWKDEFAAVPAEEIWNRINLAELSPQTISGQQELEVLILEGLKLIERLIELILDPTGDPRGLGEISVHSQTIDRNIEGIGLTHTMFGALTRMFVMEKQNLQGTDALILARETKNIYLSLQRRLEKFNKLYSHYFSLLRKE